MNIAEFNPKSFARQEIQTLKIIMISYFKFFILFLLLFITLGCGGEEIILDSSSHDKKLSTPTAADNLYWHPQPGTSWQWQLSGAINTSYDVEMYDIDLFDASYNIIDSLHKDKRTVICYFSAGSYESWRSDANQFPDEVIGKKMHGWVGEYWLDIRQIDLLAPVIEARLDLAAEKGCDGVEPDNVDGYANRTGFPLTGEDQLAYNIWLTVAAHKRGLSIGLKNDLDQVKQLEPYFDWALNEQCFEFDDCELLLPFIDAGKAVFGVEYTGSPSDYCPQAVEMGFSWLHKTLDLGDEPLGACQ